MRDLGGVIALIGMVLFIVSIITLVRPIKRIKLGTRKRAGLALGASVVLFIVGASIMPPPTPEEKAARAVADAKRAEDEKAREAAAPAATTPGRTEPTPEVTAAVQSMWTEVTNRLASCDQASGYVAEVAGRPNPSPFDLWPMVQQAEQLCRAAASEVSRIRVPDAIPRASRRSFDEAFDTCRDAYYVKSSAYGSMGEVLNGDVSPRAVTEARSASEAAQSSGLRCAVGFMKAATDLGVPVESFMPDNTSE